MHALLLTDVFYPCPGAASQRVFSFAQALSLKGFQVTVVTCNSCLKKHEALSENLLIYDFKCPRIFLSLSNVIVNPLLCFLYFFMSVVITLRNDVSVILSSVPNGETAIAGFFNSKMFRIPFIVDLRDIYPPPPVELPFLDLPTPSIINRVLSGFLRTLYKYSDRIVCAVPGIKKWLETYGIAASKIFVILNGADASIYKPASTGDRHETRLKYGLPTDKFIFVYAGSLASYLPVNIAIWAVKKLSATANDFRLLIISHANYVSYKNAVESMGIQDYVKFMGPLFVQETAEVLSACDVGIVMHRGEDYWKNTLGTKIFSYMSSGIPVLSSGPPESVVDNLIRKHGVGLYTGRPNEESFAKGLLYFLNNRDVVREMGEKARKTVEKSFDRRKLALKLVSLVDELCDKV